MDLRNWEFLATGSAVSGADVYVYDASLTHPNPNSPLASTTTDSNGMWAFTGLTATAKDVKVVYNSRPKWYKGLVETGVEQLLTKHVAGVSAAPSIAAGAGAGTGPSVSVAGTDLGGSISLTTGTGPGTNAVIATLTFALAFPAAPKAVLLTPANINARALSGTSQVWVDLASDITTTTFAFRANVALAASTAYQWYYTVIG
jgi:hypothetical protein